MAMTVMTTVVVAVVVVVVVVVAVDIFAVARVKLTCTRSD